MGQKSISKELDTAIIQDYHLLKSMRKVAAKHKLAESKITAILDAYNIPHKKRGSETRIHPLNENYFEQYLDLKTGSQVMYWLGFVAADGNVYHNPKQRRYSLAVELGNEDKNHLFKLRDALSSDAPITKVIHKGGFRAGRIWKDSVENRVSFHSKYMTNSLIQLGIVPAKSMILQFPIKLIDNPFIHSFARGYLDGDGGITFEDNRIKLYFYGTNQFLEKLAAIIDTACQIKKHKPHKNRNIFCIEYNGDEAKKVIKWMYQDIEPHLQRKYDLIKQYL
jgi:hypothetical protein